jgi:hypothetical protein
MKVSRLRAGEWLTAAAAALMLVSLLVAHWYPRRTGWQSATHLRWLLVIAIVLGTALVITQAALRAPAIPATLDVISIVVTIPTLLWLVLRVVIDAGAHQRLGGWFELLGAVGLLTGSFLALRREGIREADGPGEIPLVDLAVAGGGQSERPASPA